MSTSTYGGLVPSPLDGPAIEGVLGKTKESSKSNLNECQPLTVASLQIYIRF